MNEEWRPVKDWENVYEVSNLGRVRRIAPYSLWEGGTRIHPQTGKRVGQNPQRVLRPMLKNGYAVVCLSHGLNTEKWPTIHRLVAAAFLDVQPSPQHSINHINGNKADNRADNLEWATNREQQRHAYRNGLSNHAQFRRLTPEQAHEVFETRGNVSNRDWASRLGVTVQTISAIRNGWSYRDVTGLDAPDSRYDWFPCDRDCECRCHQRRGRVR
jgi:hypothetical protein